MEIKEGQQNSFLDKKFTGRQLLLGEAYYLVSVIIAGLFYGVLRYFNLATFKSSVITGVVVGIVSIAAWRYLVKKNKVINWR